MLSHPQSELIEASSLDHSLLIVLMGDPALGNVTFSKYTCRFVHRSEARASSFQQIAAD